MIIRKLVESELVIEFPKWCILLEVLSNYDNSEYFYHHIINFQQYIYYFPTFSFS